MINSGVRTWNEYNNYCPTSNPGSTMLCVRTAAENAWILTQSRQEIWIGYTDMLPYGGGKGTRQYGWVTGCSSTYTNWSPGQPDNNGNNEDYTYTSPNRDNKWNDVSPQDTRYCGCQYTPVLTTAPTYSPSTVAPTTSSPSTVVPTTSSPSTAAPTTSSPSTAIDVSE